MKEFKSGYWYRYTNPDKKRPEGWVGPMDFMLDGEWHKCNEGEGERGASFYVSSKPKTIWFWGEKEMRWFEELKFPIKIKTVKTEETKMRLKNVKKTNLAEAKKQHDLERKNEEVEYAKKELRAMTDLINEIDRKILSLQEDKEKLLKNIGLFDQK